MRTYGLAVELTIQSGNIRRGERRHRRHRRNNKGWQ